MCECVNCGRQAKASKNKPADLCGKCRDDMYKQNPGFKFALDTR